MKFWYNKKEGDKLASLNCSNWHEVNSMFKFTELGFVEDDDFLYLVAKAKSFSGVEKMGEKDFQLKDEIVRVKVAKKDYTKKNFKTKQDEKVEQSDVEKWLCKEFSSLDSTKRYSGFLHLQYGNVMKNLITGQDFEGNQIPDATLNMFASSYRELKEAEKSEISDDLLEIPKSTYKSFGSKSQTEAERLTERKSFYVKNFAELLSLKPEETDLMFCFAKLSENDVLATKAHEILTTVMG